MKSNTRILRYTSPLFFLMTTLLGIVRLTFGFLENPFGYGQDARFWYVGARLAGYAGSGFGYYEDTTNHILLPYVCAYTLRLRLPLRLPLLFNIACGVLTPLVLYLLLNEMYGKRTGLIGGGLLALNWYYCLQSNTLLGEVPSTFFATASLLTLFLGLNGRRHLIWFAGTLCSLAFLAKASALPLIAIEALILVHYRDRIGRADLPIHAAAYILPILAASLFPVTTYSPQSVPTHVVFSSEGMKQMVRAYLSHFPYFMSLPSIFALYGLVVLLRRRRVEDLTILSWFISFLGFHMLIGKRLMEYYSVNWLIPAFIFSAVGIEKALRDPRPPLLSLFVTISILSTCFEGPIPFVNLGTSFPYVSSKNSIKAYEKLLGALSPLNQRNQLFYNALVDFQRSERLVFTVDSILLLTVLFPLFSMLIHKLVSKKPDLQHVQK